MLTIFPLVALLAGDFFGVATFSSVCATITVSSSTVIVTFSAFFGVGAFLRVPLFAGDFVGVFTFLVTIFPPLPRVSFNGDFLGVAIFFGDVVFTGAFPLVRFAAGDLTGVCGFIVGSTSEADTDLFLFPPRTGFTLSTTVFST